MALNLDLFRKHLIYEVKADPVNIARDLEEIAKFDREAESEEQKFVRYTVGFSIGIFAFFILMFVAIFIEQFALIALGVVGLIFSIGGVIWTTIKSSSFKNLNLPNYRYQVLGKIAQMVARDMTGDSQLFVRLVLSSAEDKSKVVQTIPHPYQAGFKIDILKEEWLNLRGFLADNTHFELKLNETNQKKYGWKRNARGKSKYKSKFKCRGVNISLTLSYPLKKYGAIALLKDSALSAFKLPPQATLQKLKHGSKSMTAIASLSSDIATDENYLYQTVVMLFLSSYQVLNLAKTLSKKQA